MKKLLGIILCLCMMISLLPISVSAEGNEVSKLTFTVDEPKPGQRPTDLKVKLAETEFVEITKVEWGQLFGSVDTFEKGEDYKVTIHLKIKSGTGKCFPEMYSNQIGIYDFIVNGEYVLLSLGSDETEGVITFSFDEIGVEEVEEVEEVDINASRKGKPVSKFERGDFGTARFKDNLYMYEMPSKNSEYRITIDYSDLNPNANIFIIEEAGIPSLDNENESFYLVKFYEENRYVPADDTIYDFYKEGNLNSSSPADQNGGYISQNIKDAYGEFAKYAIYTPYYDRVTKNIEPMRRRESVADYMQAPPAFQPKKRPDELPLVGRGMLHIGDEGKQGVVKAYFSPSTSGYGRGHLINELVQIGLYYNGPEPNSYDDSFVNNVASYYYTDSPVDIIAYNDEWVAVWDEGAWTDYIFASGGCNYLYHGRYIKPGVYYYPRKNVYILDAKNNSPKPQSSTVGTATCLLAIKTAPESENYVKSGVYKTNQSFQVTNEEPINGHYQVYYAGGLYYVNATWVNLKKKGVEKPLINYTGILETSESSISFYDQPNETGNLIGKGKSGMALEILDTNASSDYAKIWFSSKECYVRKSYIKNVMATAGNMQAMGYVKPIGKIVTDTAWADYGEGFYMLAANGELKFAATLGRNTEVYVYGVDYYEEYDDGAGLNAKFKVVYKGYPGYILYDGRKDRMRFTYYEGFVNTFGTTAKTQTIIIDGEKHEILAVNIKDNNYFKIRDIAKLLSGSAKSFEVEWDAGAGCINMKSGFDYTSVGGELTKGDGSQKTAVASDAMLNYDGIIIDAACYNIDGNNYFKLRDVMDALDCRVTWNQQTQQIEVNTMLPAKEDPNEIKG